MKYAIIKEGMVVNVIEYEEQPSTPPSGFSDGHEAIPAENISVGWVYVDGQFTDPNPIIYETPEATSLTDMILSNPEELEKLKKALGISL
jgi:hypothetical protein